MITRFNRSLAHRGASRRWSIAALAGGLTACGGEAPVLPVSESGTTAEASSGGTTAGTSEATTVDPGSSSGGTQGVLDLGEPAENCFEKVWSWTDEYPWWSSRGSLVRAGSNFVTVGRRDEEVLVVAVADGGELAWGPSSLANSDFSLWPWSWVVGAPNGDVRTVASGAEGAWMERWSAAGASAGAIQLGGEGYRLGPAAATPGGEIVVGGFVGPDELDGEAVLLSVAADGAPNWELTLDHSFVDAVVVDPDGMIFMLAIDRVLEGGSVYLEAREPDGALRWSTLAGKDGGFGVLDSLSPFALAPDGASGVFTLGHHHTYGTPSMPATDAVLLARYDASGARTWEAEVSAPTTPLRGGLTLAGEDALIWAVGFVDETQLALYGLDGELRCTQMVPGVAVQEVLAVERDEVVVVGSVHAKPGPWLARYKAITL